jgi:cyd operon protein YbgT
MMRIAAATGPVAAVHTPRSANMWYFAWILGVGFAVLLAVLNAMWGESEEDRAASLRNRT